MPRARNIKPGFFQNEELAELPCEDRLFFIGLWTYADFKGCMEYRPKRLKVAIMPYEDGFVVSESVQRLINSGFVRKYVVGGQEYLKVDKFVKHQRPHKNEIAAGSEIPDESDGVAVSDGARKDLEESPNNSGVEPINSEPLALNTDTLNTDSFNPQPSDAEVCFLYWKEVMGKNGTTTFTKQRKKLVTDRLKKYSAEQVKMAIDGCKRSSYHQGDNERHAVYNDLDLICRDDTKLEKFIELAVATRPTNGNGKFYDPGKSAPTNGTTDTVCPHCGKDACLKDHREDFDKKQETAQCQNRQHP